MDTTIHPPAATTYSVATNAPADQCLTEINNQRTTDDNVDNNVNNKAQRKVRSACDACQDAKIRCGREKPTCRRCQNQGRTCMYSHTRPLGRPRKINNSSTTANMNRNVDSLPDQRTQSDDAMMAPGSESGNPGSGTPLIPRSISRTNTESNNNNGTNPSMNDDWPDLPPLLSAEPRKPIHMSLDAMDDMEPSATSSGHNHMNVGLEPITQNTEMDMDMDMFMVADHHLFPALEEEDGQDDHHHHHQQRRGPRSLDSDPMTTGTTTEWDLGFQFDQALSSASSSSLNSGSTGAYAGDVLASSLTSKVGMELGGSHKISANSLTMGSQKKFSRGSFRDDQFTHHDSLGSRSPKTTVSSSASSAVLNSISTTTSYSGRSRGEEVLLLSRQRMQCTCCDFVLQILADLDRHLSDRSVTSLDLIMKLERESRARTVTILQCDSCPQTFRPRIFLLMGLVLEAVVELLEKILHQNQLLGGLATTSSSSSSIPSGLAGTGLVLPPASGVYNNSNTTTPNRQGETISSCSLWLGDYEISGHEKHEFLKHLVAARLRDIAGTIRQLHQSMNQYRHRPAFEVGTSMLVEIYRHVHALVKLLNQ